MSVFSVLHDSKFLKKTLFTALDETSNLKELFKLVENIPSLDENFSQIKNYFKNKIKSKCKSNSNKALNLYRSFHLKTTNILNILNDDLIVKSVQYLDTKEYSKLFVISTNFNKIMLNNKILYKDYKI